MRIRPADLLLRRRSIRFLLILFILAGGWALVSWRIAAEGEPKAALLRLPFKKPTLRSNQLAVVIADGGQDPVNAFNVKLLRLILDRSGSSYAISIYPRSFNQDKMVRALETSEEFALSAVEHVNVAVMGADSTLNRRLRRVPIPIAGGLLGMRVGFVHRQYLPLMEQIRSRDDLSYLTLLQGVGWRDVDILDASGMKTYAARPDELLRILDSGRVHLFLRGVGEIDREYPSVRRSTRHVVVDPYLLITYPFAGFFYVNKANARLAAVLEHGFRQAIADGSYQALLERELITDALRNRLNLRDRRVIHLSNPDAEAALEGVNPEFWILPWADLANGRIRSGEQLCQLRWLKKLC